MRSTHIHTQIYKACFLTALSIVFSLTSASAQRMTYSGFPSLVWPKLYNISFVQAQDELGEYEKPVFTDAVKALEGKTIVLPGYMMPLERSSSKQIMFSSLPVNACFFCGVGGPETAAEVNLKSATKWIGEPIEVRGVLRLNDSDPDQLYYTLDDAEILGPIR